MNNGEKFWEVFGLYATEMWAKSERDFLEWLNSEYSKPENTEESEKEEKNSYLF